MLPKCLHNLNLKTIPESMRFEGKYFYLPLEPNTMLFHFTCFMNNNCALSLKGFRKTYRSQHDGFGVS